MGGLPYLALIGAAVALRPLDVRLWRVGRISDRTAAVLLLGRFPAVCLLGSWAAGGSLPVVLGLTALGLVPVPLFYGLTLDLLREQKRERAKAAGRQ